MLAGNELMFFVCGMGRSLLHGQQALIHNRGKSKRFITGVSMTDRQFGLEQRCAAILVLVTLVALAWFSNFTNADISFPALMIALLALLVSIVGKRDVSS